MQTIRRYISAITVLFVVALGLPMSAAADWNQPFAGTLNVDANAIADSSRITSVAGVPVVAWLEWTWFPNQIYVRQLTGGAWAMLGGSLNISPAEDANGLSIADVSGAPHVSWSEENGVAKQIRVKAFTGGAWATLGGSLNNVGAHDAISTDIANIGGVPYVVFAESNTTAYQIYVKRWTGVTWASVGASLNMNAANSATNPRIIGINGAPYATWSEDNGSGVDQVHVKQFSSGTWNAVGGVLNVDAGKDAWAPVIVAVGGAPYVAWSEDITSGINRQVHVKQYSGGTWNAVGTILNIDPTRYAASPGIADVNGVPYATWAEDDDAHFRVHVKQFTGGAWSGVGSVLNVDPARTVQAPVIANISGTPYVTWIEADNAGFQVRVKRLEADVAPPPPPPLVIVPANTTPPKITGKTRVGKALRTSTGTWSGTTPIAYTYRWLRCDKKKSAKKCKAIKKAIASKYKLVRQDTRHRVRVRVTATNTAGTATALSKATPVIQKKS